MSEYGSCCLIIGEGEYVTMMERDVPPFQSLQWKKQRGAVAMRVIHQFILKNNRQ